MVPNDPGNECGVWSHVIGEIERLPSHLGAYVTRRDLKQPPSGISLHVVRSYTRVTAQDAASPFVWLALYLQPAYPVD